VGINAEYKEFIANTTQAVSDKEQYDKINFSIRQYDNAVADGLKRYAKLDVAKQRAGYIKHKVINDLDRYLIEFEDNFTANGGKIVWARNADEALHEIDKLIKKHEVTSVVKSKSMVTEEIALNSHLIKNNVSVVETDLGEFIVQLANDKPFHIVTPAMHFSKKDVADLYHEKLDTAENLSPEQITEYTRLYLRDKFASAQMGITGAIHVIA